MIEKIREILKCSLKEKDEEIDEKINKITEVILGKGELPFKELKDLCNIFTERPLALISFDADRIKEYIFSSRRLADIWGASEIIKELSESSRDSPLYKGIPEPFEIIFSGGGTGLLIAPASNAEIIKKKVEENFKDYTLTSSCSVVYEVFYPYELVYGRESPKNINTKIIEICNGGNGTIKLGKIVAHLGSLLRGEKDRKLRANFNSISGIFKRCDACGVEVATKKVETPEGREEFICDSCFKKREKSKDRTGKARSLEDIVGKGKRYLGLVYGDINKTGKILEELSKIEEYRDISVKIDKIREGVIREVVKDLKLDGRYQDPIIGGDDILLIVPADKTLECVIKITDSFEELKKCLSLNRLSLSIGFVIVPSHFPISFAMRYVEDVLREAKKLSYRTDGMPSTVDYMVIKDSSPLSTSIEDLRKREYIYSLSRYGEKIKLTCRPYLFEEFKEKTYKMVNALRYIPNTQLHIIADALRDTPKIAHTNVAYQIVRNKSYWEELSKELIGNINLETVLNEYIICSTGKNALYKTYFIDALELYEFLEGG